MMTGGQSSLLEWVSTTNDNIIVIDVSKQKGGKLGKLFDEVSGRVNINPQLLTTSACK